MKDTLYTILTLAVVNGCITRELRNGNWQAVNILSDLAREVEAALKKAGRLQV